MEISEDVLRNILADWEDFYFRLKISSINFSALAVESRLNSSNPEKFPS